VTDTTRGQNPLLKLVYWYVNTLDKYPLTVKMITSGVMYGAFVVVHFFFFFAPVGPLTTPNSQIGLGDLLAQVVDPLRKKEQPLDWQRTGIFALYGTIIAGPLYHYWYGNLNQLPVFMMKTRRLNQHVLFILLSVCPLNLPLSRSSTSASSERLNDWESPSLLTRW